MRKTSGLWPIIGSIALSCAPLAWAAPGAGDVTNLVVEEVRDEDPALNLVWRIQQVQLTGLGSDVETSVNTAIQRMTHEPLGELVQDLQIDPGNAASAHTKNGLRVETTVGILTDDLLSVEVKTSTFYAGASHPNDAITTATFDLKTGAEIRTRELFAAADKHYLKVADRVTHALRANFQVAEQFAVEVSPDQLRSVLVTPQGLKFIWSEGELVPAAAGLLYAELSWQDLRERLSPALEKLAQTLPPPPVKPAISINVPLGEGDVALGANDESLDDPSALNGRYWEFLKEETLKRIAPLSEAARKTLSGDSRWREAEAGAPFFDSLDELGQGAIVDAMSDATLATLKSEPMFKSLPRTSVRGTVEDLRAILVIALEPTEAESAQDCGAPAKKCGPPNPTAGLTEALRRTSR